MFRRFLGGVGNWGDSAGGRFGHVVCADHPRREKRGAMNMNQVHIVVLRQRKSFASMSDAMKYVERGIKLKLWLNWIFGL